MSFDPLQFIELWVVLAFVAAWLVLEWQGRRLDRMRSAREDASKPDESQASSTHPAKEAHISHEGAHPPG